MPDIGVLKEPSNVKSKGRPQGTKRLPTAVELIDRKIEAEKKAAVKREKAKQKQAEKPMEQPAVKRIKLVIRQPTAANEGSKYVGQWCIIRLRLMQTFNNPCNSCQNVVNGIPVDPLIAAIFVKSVYNPKADVNCGFRAVAKALMNDEERWWPVKQAMSSHLQKNLEKYQNHLCYDVHDLSKTLSCSSSPCTSEYWFLAES